METRENITPEILSERGFKQTDWFYSKMVNGKEFTIGFLFVNTFLKGEEFDLVDIFYDRNQLFKIPMAYLFELEFFYEKLTGKKLQKTHGSKKTRNY